MDEQSEQDEGYVTLVNAKYDQNGELVETTERTGIWAWKHPHEDGTLTYTKLTGDVRFFSTWTLPTLPKSPSCTTSRSLQSPVRSWPLSARPARARPRSQT